MIQFGMILIAQWFILYYHLHAGLGLCKYFPVVIFCYIAGCLELCCFVLLWKIKFHFHFNLSVLGQ